VFHHVPGGKGELIGAIGARQLERVLDARPPTSTSSTPGRPGIAAVTRSRRTMAPSLTGDVGDQSAHRGAQHLAAHGRGRTSPSQRPSVSANAPQSSETRSGGRRVRADRHGTRRPY